MPGTDAQLWHRDGWTFSTPEDHITSHCGQRCPLTDVCRRLGQYDRIVPGHTIDIEQVAGDVVKKWQSGTRRNSTRGRGRNVKAGTAVVFDTRVLHRGLAMPVCATNPFYFLPWLWKTQNNTCFKPSRLCGNPRDKAHQKKNGYFSLCRDVYRTKVTDYASPL
jgi:hypothetical protein